MDVTAYIGEDRAIYFGLERVGPGDELFGQPFAYWRAFLEERGGAAVVEMVIEHYHPPCFAYPGDCPQHPRDQYDDMSRQVENWYRLLRKQEREHRRGARLMRLQMG